MFNMGNGFSLSDIATAVGGGRNNEGMFGNGGAWWIIILFLFMFMGWGNRGWGNEGGSPAMQGALTRGELCQDMNFSQVENGVRGIQQGLCDGFYAMNTSVLNGFHGVDNAICNLGYQQAQLVNGVNQNINEARFDAKSCCCETNRNIDAVRYENSRNTCDITTNANLNTRDIIEAQNAGFQRIADMMQQNKIESLRSELEGARYQLSNMAQTQALVDQLKPCPIPAYLTCSPYSSFNPYTYNGFNGFGNGCGCNCA